MGVEQKLEEAEGKRQKVLNQVNAMADEIEDLRQRRQAMLQEALRLDGEVRALTALKEEGD